ncbi:ComF family protein [Marinicellulosiphila megalodicopiae]|uniref:ComF family protein n=1 Tax=Marinicellulosiphila megalodicopiae TaxID=2724896 RepID=UPI003BAFE5BD
MIIGAPQESNFALNKVYQWLFVEQACQLCHIPSKESICTHCYETLDFNIYACPHCAHPSEMGELCKICVSQAFYFDDALAPFLYEGEVKNLVKQIKYSGDFYALPTLCEPLIQRITVKPDAIVYVPSHESRHHQRGFNQSQILAQHISKHLHTPIFDWINRVKSTPTLAQHSKKQRAKLLKGAFQCHSQVPEHVAIVDDILTTGATVNELSKVLRKKGAKRISIWTLARAVAH